MYYMCCDCDHSFDSDGKPNRCPFCDSEREFAEIKVTDDEGHELTFKEYITDMRKYYMTHLPYGMTRKEIEKMDDFDLERMSDILSE